MMTIGDVLGVTGLVLSLGICSWAIMTAVALLFPKRCQTSREAIESAPWGTIVKGFLTTLVVGVIGIAFLSSPVPALKLVGWTIETGLLAVASVGAGGLAMLLGARLKNLQPDMSDYSRLSRGAALAFICSAAPVIGWFLIGPVVLGLSVGAGMRALFVRQESAVGDLS